MARAAIRETTRAGLNTAVTRLGEDLPQGWTVDIAVRDQDGGTVVISSRREDGPLSLWVRRELTPREVPALPSPDGPTVIAARWLSPRTRHLLRDRGIGWIDQTGNVEVNLSTPGLVVRTAGAARDPQPKPAVAPSLRGPRAWALLRTIAEVAPPYGVSDLSQALSIDSGYVSRLLKVLEGELLIDRAPRGPVTGVDWEGVLRQIASTYSVFDSNETSTWVAAAGPEQLLADLAGRSAGSWALSGSFASADIVSVAAPTTALIYTTDAERLAKVGHLLPATSGANVVLAVPYDEIVFQRTRRNANVPTVSMAQLAVDGLTGNGRMPEEAEALVAWMRRNVTRWQAPSLAQTASTN